MPRWSLVVVLAASVAFGGCGSHHSPAAPTPPPDSGGGTPPSGPAPPPSPPPTLSVSKILAFGDSMTAGTTSPVRSLALTAGLSTSYPYKLQALETARYTSQTITVLNAGLAGEKTVDGAKRLDSAIKDADGPQVLLLMEGANDLSTLESAGSNAAITAIASAMEDMVRDAQRQGLTVMVATLPPEIAGLPKASGAPFVTRYNDALRTMAAKKGATLVDVYAQFPPDLIGQDGLHPTEAGYDLIAKIFQDAIAAKWEQPPASAR